MKCNHDPSTCLLCYSNVRCRSNYKGHKGYRACKGSNECEDVMAKFLKKPASQQRVDHGDCVAAQMSSIDCEIPALVEFLSLGRWEDGKPRKTGTLLIFAEDGLWKACVADRDGNQVAFVSSDSFKGILDEVNDKILQGELEWRKRYAGKK